LLIGKILEREDFIATLSLFIFLSLAAIDELAIKTGWFLVFSRIIMMMAALMASISYPSSLK